MILADAKLPEIDETAAKALRLPVGISSPLWLMIGSAAHSGGCRAPHAVRTQDYATVSSAIADSYRNPAAVHAAIPPAAAELAGPRPVQDYIAFALGRNAGIQAARSRVDAAANRVPQAASLEDPMFTANGWPFYPNVPQTAGGRMTAEVMVSQQVPWMGKLRGRAEAAEAEVNAARARLAAEELNTIEAVKRAYYDLHLAEQSIRITEQNRSLLAQVLQIAEARYQTGATSQQDVTSARARRINLSARRPVLGGFLSRKPCTRGTPRQHVLSGVKDFSRRVDAAVRILPRTWTQTATCGS